MKNIFVLVIALLIGTSFSFAENDEVTDNAAPTANLMGKVIDESTGETLAGVMVQLEGTDKYVFSDFDGNFKFENLKPAKYEISVSLISYKKVETEIDLKNTLSEELEVKLTNIN
jgi:hypothetical protein